MNSIKDLKQSSQYNVFRNKLRENTQIAAEKLGIFTTPSMIVNKSTLLVGIERLPNVEQILEKRSHRLPPSRISTVPAVGNASNVLEFYFDFSSPWAFLGYCRLFELKGFVEHIKLKPILLGALFRDIGTPNAPGMAMSEAMRGYGSLDLERWRKIAGVNLTFNSHFPIRTVLPLRVFIVDQRTIDCLYRGAWCWNVNIGDPKQLCQLLNDYGFDGQKLIEKASTDQRVKAILKQNTEFAKNKGMFGVPSYVVNDDYDRFIWGQDKLDMIKDLCCGWKPMFNHKRSSNAKL